MQSRALETSHRLSVIPYNEQENAVARCACVCEGNKNNEINRDWCFAEASRGSVFEPQKQNSSMSEQLLCRFAGESVDCRAP